MSVGLRSKDTLENPKFKIQNQEFRIEPHPRPPGAGRQMFFDDGAELLRRYRLPGTMSRSSIS